ncbi:ABC transporter ATP-binding protein [Bacillus testis]|uniref:ABC transporter ATP-binding protein n=1 Tax=Bacillus testis TaxID=1622072 RepID=UPI00067F081C|nr:ABC transporter ATP-binding protein [Bacillus testis]
MKTVWSYCRPYKISAAIALFFMIAELVVELVQPLLMAKIINNGIMVKNLEVVAIWGGIILALSLLGFLSGIMNTYYASHVSQSFGADIRKNVFEKVQSFSYAQFSLFAAGSLMTRLTNDVQQLQNTMFMGLRIMARAPLLIFGGLIMAFIVHPSLAVYLAVVVPCLFLFLVFFMGKGGRMFKVVQEKLDEVNNVMGENLAGMKLIRAFLRKSHEVSRFEDASEQLRKKTASVLQFMEISMPALLFLMNAATICILWFGNQEITVGTANVGEVVAVVNYATRITGSLSVLSFIIMAFSRSRASAARLNEVLNAPEEMEDHEDTFKIEAMRGDICFENVSFRYVGQSFSALDHVSFSLKAGCTMAILGSTGSGKSTLVNMIPRLYDPSEGRITIDGIDLREYDQRMLRRQIGLVPQEPLLFTGSVVENIRWGKRNASKEEVVKACKDAQIYETVMKLPQQMDTKIGQKGVNLSGGQRQRLSIARALVRKPRILLFDDSTSALDVKTEMELLQALKAYRGTKLIVTQKISTAIHADLIMLLQDGKKAAIGTHQELMESSALYREIIQSQGGERRSVYVEKANK